MVIDEYAVDRDSGQFKAPFGLFSKAQTKRGKKKVSYTAETNH
jgi:hypothetical protein